MVDRALADMGDVFGLMYAATGRSSIPPEQLRRALVLQMTQTIRSERQLMEQIKFNIMFHWFVGLGINEQVWHPATFTHNRDRAAHPRHR